MADDSNVLPFKRPAKKSGKAAAKSPDAPAQPANFQSFVEYAVAGESGAATQQLVQIFALPEARCRESAQWFMERAKKDPGFIRETQQMRHHLLARDQTSLLMSLYTGFGLQGPEAVVIAVRLQNLLDAK